MKRRPLTFVERSVLKSIRSGAEVYEGYWIAFGEEILRQHGVAGAVKWGVFTWRIRADLIRRFGERENHWVSAFASLWNGCEYCAFGNLVAFNLHWFKETGELFPLAEADCLKLLRMRDAEVITEVRRVLHDARYARLIDLMDRQYQIKSGTLVVDSDEDRLLQRSLRLYDFINECSIVADAPAPPLGSIAHDTDLLVRYRAARPLPERLFGTEKHESLNASVADEEKRSK